MNTGKETWKWGVVVLLLAIFLITANQAYQHIANQEEFEAPDDYLKGDSWDLEHGSGPGAGQPMQITTDYNRSQTTPEQVGSNNSSLNGNLTSPEPIILEDNVNWNQSDSDSEQAPNKVDSVINNSSDNNPQSGMYEIFTTPSVNEANSSSSKENLKEPSTPENTESATEATKQIINSEANASDAISTEAPTEIPAQSAKEQINNSEQAPDIPSAQ